MNYRPRWTHCIRSHQARCIWEPPSRCKRQRVYRSGVSLSDPGDAHLTGRCRAPEVLTTPGASFLGSGGGIRGRASLAKRLRSEAAPRTPDLRVMRKFQRFRKEPKLAELQVYGIEALGPDGSSWCEVTPPFNELRGQNSLESFGSNSLISGYRDGGVTTQSAPRRCRWCCQ
jgi:hypothetical protein